MWSGQEVDGILSSCRWDLPEWIKQLWQPKSKSQLSWACIQNKEMRERVDSIPASSGSDRHIEIWGAADEVVLIKVLKKSAKNSLL